VANKLVNVETSHSTNLIIENNVNFYCFYEVCEVI